MDSRTRSRALHLGQDCERAGDSERNEIEHRLQQKPTKMGTGNGIRAGQAVNHCVTAFQASC